jgi:hypothetical protein
MTNSIGGVVDVGGDLGGGMRHRNGHEGWRRGVAPCAEKPLTCGVEKGRRGQETRENAQNSEQGRGRAERSLLFSVCLLATKYQAFFSVIEYTTPPPNPGFSSEARHRGPRRRADVALRHTHTRASRCVLRRIQASASTSAPKRNTCLRRKRKRKSAQKTLALAQETRTVSWCDRISPPARCTQTNPGPPGHGRVTLTCHGTRGPREAFARTRQKNAGSEDRAARRALGGAPPSGGEGRRCPLQLPRRRRGGVCWVHH